MAIYPVILDSRPAYLAHARGCASVLMLPHGHSTVGAQIAGALLARTKRHALVIRSFEAPPGYDEALAPILPRRRSQSSVDFRREMVAIEPSDWILAVDPRLFPAIGFDDPALLDELLDDLVATPRIARHLVALGATEAGTSERLEFDVEGRLRRIQRYYDSVTWTVTAGILCSLVPASSLAHATEASFDSLLDLRRGLLEQNVASRDVPLRGASFDLSTERGLLQLTEHVLSSPPSSSETSPVPGRGGIHTTARIIGDVAVHPDVTIGEQVTLIGPSVVGRGAIIERGAVIAQSVVLPGVLATEGAVVRRRVATGAESGGVGDQLAVAAGEADSGSIRLTEQVRRPWFYPWLKLIFESTAAAVALLLLSPLFLVLAILVKLGSKGSVFYADLREAKDGKPLRCFKFRTMVVDADSAQSELMAANQVDGPQFKMERDPRVTGVGRLLRITSLDELPQLINVALGQMSLVGPRPSPFRENQTCVPWRDARLSVRPGITGLWQVCRHNRSSGDFHQWIYYDMLYVRHISLWVDIKILLATAYTLGGQRHVPLSWILPGMPDGSQGA